MPRNFELQNVGPGDRVVVDEVRGRRVTWLTHGGVGPAAQLAIDTTTLEADCFEAPSIEVDRFALDAIIHWALARLPQPAIPRVVIWDDPSRPRLGVFTVDDPDPEVEAAVQEVSGPPGYGTCLAHLLPEPCPTCAAYIAAGL